MALHRSILDAEKQETHEVVAPDRNVPTTSSQPQQGQSRSAINLFKRWNTKIESLSGLETRGITRVLPSEKQQQHPASHHYSQMFALWFGMSLSVINLVLGLLGPQVFRLGWKDSVCITVFANALASAGPAYLATFGPESGLRTMCLGRYFMGFWPQRLVCLLNVVMQTGWGVIGAIVAGQLISAVNGGGLTIAVGCVIAALCIGVLNVFGIAILHIYERYASYVQAFALLILIGASGRDWDTSLPSTGDPSTVTANRCSFFALLFSAVIGFSAISADFYIYYPIHTNKPLTFLTTWTGLWTSIVSAELIGVGLATGIAQTPTWTSAYNTSPGALLKTAYEGLGAFANLCVVLLALGCIQNIAPATYVAALSIQTLRRSAERVPRWVLCVFLMIVQLVCAVAGRRNLYDIFDNFLPIMAYWVCPWITIVAEEHVVFHILRGVPFDWTIWQDRARLPVGGAAMFAWLVGWAGAIVGMAQVWYTGPVAMKIGGYGGDIGGWLAIAFAGLTYPPLRYLELQKFGR